MHGIKSLKKAHTKDYAPEFLILRALNSLVVCYIYTKIMLNMELNMMLIVLMAGVCIYYTFLTFTANSMNPLKFKLVKR